MVQGEQTTKKPSQPKFNCKENHGQAKLLAVQVRANDITPSLIWLSESDRTAEWDGVRNYQARNFMRDQMKVGDGVLFYHSSTASRAVVGTARVVQEGYPDHTAWDSNSGHFDPKSKSVNPIWFMVDILPRRNRSSPGR